MRYLYFDTETTGKFIFGRHPLHPTQPHLAQLGAILKEDGQIVDSINILVETPVPMPDDTAAFHGITNEKLKRYSVSAVNACHIFRDLATCADVLVAHNIVFDKAIMLKALAENGVDEIPWDTITQHCTMLASTPVVNIRTARGPKWPTLEECMRFFFDESHEGAHDALVDVNACIRVHEELLNRNIL